MNVLIVHYHMNPGGVSRIIDSQVKGLSGFMDPSEITIACGPSHKPLSDPAVRVIENDYLSYSENILSPAEMNLRISGIMSFLENNMPAGTILHCHNPNLGKNPALIIALYRLAGKGALILNHCHDFPEDRPSNIGLIRSTVMELCSVPVEEVLYPRFPGYHYGVLNSCDYNRLHQKGIPDENLLLLPNPVEAIKRATRKLSRQQVCKKLGTDPSRMLVTYPVRAIRRKNLGEFILLSTLFSEKADFVITLAPLNPAELPSYDRWKEFCRENHIGITFEAAKIVNYEELLPASDFCITTSIQEGFGMTFLEPWLSGVPVAGRELECVVNDMKAKGLEFTRLYRRITIPQYEDKDFKDIPVPDQEKVIRNLKSGKEPAEILFRANPWLAGLFDPVPGSTISSNRNNIILHFSTEAYGKRLFELYRKIAG